jgi:hypothetical protein
MAPKHLPVEAPPILSYITLPLMIHKTEAGQFQVSYASCTIVQISRSTIFFRSIDMFSNKKLPAKVHDREFINVPESDDLVKKP